MSFSVSSGHSVSFDAVSGSQTLNVKEDLRVSLPRGDPDDSSNHYELAPGFPGFPWLSPPSSTPAAQEVPGSLVKRSGPPKDRESVLLEQSSSISQVPGRSREYLHVSQHLPIEEDALNNPNEQESEGCSRSGASSLFNQVLDGSLVHGVQPPPGFHPGV